MGYSPVLGALTAAFEILAALWGLKTNVRKPVRRLIALTFLLLAIYQTLELAICLSPQESRPLLSRLAFLDVTWLPPVSLLLIAHMVSPRSKALFRFAHVALGLAGAMSLWITVDYRFISGTICAFMYARYFFLQPYFHLYGAFYEITQMCIIFIPAWQVVRAEDPMVRQNLGDILMGSLLYIIPSLFLTSVLPGPFRDALPSVMCHFALFYAIFLLQILRREDRLQRGQPVVQPLLESLS